MDPEYLDLPVQGMSDLQACYDHALAGLVKAGTDLDHAGTELNRAQITFHNAIDDYFNQLQLQIDSKDKAIRLMLEQKIETSGVMFSLQNQLTKLQDEKTTLNAKNVYLTGLLNANSPGENLPGNSSIIPFGLGPYHNSQYLKVVGDTHGSLGNETFEVRDRKSGPPPNRTDHSALTHHTTLNHRFASSLNRDHGSDALEIVPYQAALRDHEGQRRCDEAGENCKC